MTRNASGFTLIEVMVAVIILSVGILALASGSGAVYRMLGAGKRSTKAAAIASERMELLRRQANATNPRCSAVAGGSATRPGNVTETWTVAGTGSSRTVKVWVRYPTSRGTTADTLFTTLPCD